MTSMHSPDLILVTGATGEYRFRRSTSPGGSRCTGAGTPSPQLRGADRANPSTETVVGDFDDPASLNRVLEGVTRAYLVTPSSPDAEAQQIQFAELAAAAGVTHIVK